MSTTDNPLTLTTEQYLKDVVTTYETELKTSQEKMKGTLNLDRMSLCDSPQEAILALICSEKANKGYNGIETSMYSKLSKKMRLKLTRGFDVYTSFECVTYPGEKVESATLYTAIPLPKDEELRNMVVKGEELENNSEILKRLRLRLGGWETLESIKDWIYCQSLIDFHYMPIKTITDINGQFQFYEEPLYMFSPYQYLSIEIKFSSLSPATIGYGYKKLKLNTITMSLDIRNKMIGQKQDPILKKLINEINNK